MIGANPKYRNAKCKTESNSRIPNMQATKHNNS